MLDRETIERISTRNLKRIKFNDKDPRVNEQIDEIEEMTSRQIDVLRKIVREKVEKLQKGDELPPGVIKLVKVYIAMKRKLSRGRQDGRPPRQQGRHRAHSAGRGHAVPRRRDAGGDRPESAGRAQPYERGPDSGDAPGLGRQEIGQKIAELMQRNARPRRFARACRVVQGHAVRCRSGGLDDETLMKIAEGMQDRAYFASPVFDGSKEKEIKALLERSGLPTSGKTYSTTA